MRASVRMRVRLGKRCLHSVLVRECIFVPECGAARGCACPFATTHGGQECAHTNNSLVTLQNISIVDVRGGTAIRDDILLTARRTSVLQSMKCHHEWPRHRSHLLCSAQKWSLPRSQAPCSLINERYGCMRMRGCCELDLCMAFTIALGAGRLQGMEDRRASAKML